MKKILMYFIIILIISSCNLFNSNKLNLRNGIEGNIKEIDKLIFNVLGTENNNFIFVKYYRSPMFYRNQPTLQSYYLFVFKNRNSNNVELYKYKNNNLNKVSEFNFDLDLFKNEIQNDTIIKRNNPYEHLRNNAITINYWIKLDQHRLFFSQFDNSFSNIEYFKGHRISKLITLYLSIGIIESELSK